jgi:hypothetical protein
MFRLSRVIIRPYNEQIQGYLSVQREISNDHHFQLARNSRSIVQQQIDTGSVIPSVHTDWKIFYLYRKRYDTVSNTCDR